MLVITTPTGRIGRQVLDTVLEGPGELAHSVRVVVRDPSRLSRGTAERVEIVRGSLTDADVLAAAFVGADSVFWLLPSDPRASSVHAHVQSFTRPLCRALIDCGVERLVYVTGLDSGLDAGDGLAPGGPGVDELIAQTGVHNRALRLPGFMENLLQQLGPLHQGRFFYPISGDRRLPTIATRDVAAAAADLLLDGSWSGQAGVPLLGAEDLSYDDMARIMTEVLDRPISYQQVPADAFAAGLVRQGMSQSWAQGLTDLLLAVDRGVYNNEPRTSRSTTATTFRRWCHDVLEPAFAT